MEDRVPTKPNRVLIKPEDGSPSFYATMTRADEPTQVGDPLNKSTFLTDQVAGTICPDKENPLPNDAFLSLWNEIKRTEPQIAARTRCVVGSYEGTGKYGKAHQNTLTFDFIPKFVLIYAVSGDPFGEPLFFIRGFNGAHIMLDLVSTTKTNIATWGDTDLSWYSSDNAISQHNVDGITYAYVAFGDEEVE